MDREGVPMFSQTAEFYDLLGTDEDIRHVEERHEPGLFSDEEYSEAFESAGLLSVRKDPGGISDRGLWLGVAAR